MSLQRYKDYALPLTDSDGVRYLSTLAFLDLLYSGDVEFHEVLPHEAGRLDLIAYKYPQSKDFFNWPLFAMLNPDIFDPVIDLYAGRIIAIPKSPIATKGNNDIVPFTYIGT